MLTTTQFETSVLKHLRREGLTVRRILRTFPPYDSDEPIEVLIVSTKGEPATCWVDHAGVLLHGPVPGFGEMA